MRLHKLPNGYVLTSDEVIKIGDKVYPKTVNIHGGNVISECIAFGHGCWSNHIITELTDEKGYHPSHLLKVIAQDFDFSSLSPEEQKEIGWVDVEELYPAGKRGAMSIPSRKECNNYLRQEGFRKAQELLSDRRFTEEDIIKAFKAGQLDKSNNWYGGDVNQYLQSLSQPKSWEVEVEMETVYEDKLEGTEFIPRPVSKQPKLTNGKAKILRIL